MSGKSIYGIYHEKIDKFYQESDNSAAKAKIIVANEIDLDEVIIGGKSLSCMLNEIHQKVSKCIQDISIERQKITPDYEDIDAPLYAVLNLIEKTRGY